MSSLLVWAIPGFTCNDHLLELIFSDHDIYDYLFCQNHFSCNIYSAFIKASCSHRGKKHGVVSHTQRKHNLRAGMCWKWPTKQTLRVFSFFWSEVKASKSWKQWTPYLFLKLPYENPSNTDSDWPFHHLRYLLLTDSNIVQSSSTSFFLIFLSGSTTIYIWHLKQFPMHVFPH